MQPGDPDDAVLARFADEAADSLAALGEALLRLETDPAPDVYSDATRHLHTLQGAASAAGLSAAAHLAHLLEDVMAECQAGRLAHTPALNDVLLRALDMVAAIRLSIFEGGTGQVELSGSFTALESILADGRQVTGLSSDASQVLSEYQRFRARHAIAAGRTLLEIRLDLERDQFGERVPALESRVAAVAEVLARTGASDVPPSADTTYLLLVATADEEAAVRTATELGARVRRVAEHSAGAFAVAPAPQVATAGPPAAAPPPLAGLTAEQAAEIQAEIRALRGEFLESSLEKVAQLAQGLVGLEGRSDDADLVNALFRIAHSLKGGGATFGLPALSAVAHALEGVLDEIRCGRRRPTPETVSTLLTGADALQLVIRQPDAVTEQSPEIVTAIGSLKSDGRLSS
ncbi:MAG: hypothetical protein A3H96_13435 [Acidobacteria bacterium RIFCSPLOWO2_02_FULL_67_36]|nr:MAG: hypothetical protein A3H96_13435 [Acidobacteria bacterium RIFCSPLOWO2_02_FULL_67_36]OFW18552.1 MAG: hypothetical protein A3G21_21000 [Acidobacteria bacterium RIFCSPLOWO2_12_FULL_66_21]